MPESNPRSIPALSVLQGRLLALRPAEGRVHGPLVVVPLLGDDVAADPILGSDALSTGAAQIRELDGGGQVSELLVRNDGARDALFLLGDELIGGKQHRTLNTHVLVRSGESSRLPVSCIEAGRWRESGDGFSFHCRAEPRSVPRRLRSGLARQTRTSLRSQRLCRSDQGAVWGEVDRMLAQHQASSRTSALSDLLDRKEPNTVEQLEVLGEQVGFAAWRSGRLVALELLATASLYAAAHKRLLRSSSWGHADGMKPAGGLNVNESTATAGLLEQLVDMGWERHPGVAGGTEVRAGLRGQEMVGLLDDGAVVALSVLSEL